MERALVRERPPASLGGLLRWFAQQMEAETPVRLSVRGVEWDGDGGSLLGTPRWAPQFRALIHACSGGIESAVNEDGDYIWPCRAALARMARNRKPLIARWLIGLSLAGYDWRCYADAVGQPLEYARLITEGGLAMLWTEYSVSPLVRIA